MIGYRSCHPSARPGCRAFSQLPQREDYQCLPRSAQNSGQSLHVTQGWIEVLALLLLFHLVNHLAFNLLMGVRLESLRRVEKPGV